MKEGNVKKAIVCISLMAMVPFFFVWAQDGTSDGTSRGISDIKGESVEIPSEEMSAGTPPETGLQTTESTLPGEATPREMPVPPAPVPDDSAPIDTNNIGAEPIALPLDASGEEEEKKSNVTSFALLLLAVAVMFAALSQYFLRTKKTKNKQDKKKDDSRCFNIKKMMEDKLNEATDLRGKIEGAAKDKARGIVRDSIESTPLADVMAATERAEKEYNRLRALYEKCIIEVEKEEPHMPISIKGIIFENGKVWFRKNERGEWELPGGKPNEGEQPKQTLMREIKEELGFDVDAKDAVDSYIYEIKKGELRVFIVSYLCNILKKSGEFGTTGRTESAEFKLFAQEEIANLNMPQFYKNMIMKAQELLKKN